MLMKLRDERGVALVTALLVSMVLFSLSLVVVQLSLHNSGQSSYDRRRYQAIDAAEAGIDAAFSKIQGTTTASLPCGPDSFQGTLATNPAASYSVSLTYYDTAPPSDAPLVCPLTARSAPLSAELVSVGTAVVTGNPDSVSRTMQTEVRLHARRGGLGNAIFSDTGLNLSNHLTVNGYSGNDGDIYTNGNLTCGNTSQIAGSIYAQGTIAMSNGCTAFQDVWADGSVSMIQSANAGHDVTSSTSSISLSNSAAIQHNATAGTTCSGCTGAVGGTITTGHISSAPPAYTLPTLEYDASAWQAAGFDTTHSYSDCSAAQSFINDVGSATKYAVRITPACALSWGNNSTINLRSDLAIITDGSISTVNQAIFQAADGQVHTLYLIVPTSAGSGGCSGGNHDISLSNNSTFTNVQVFAYSPCTVTYNNNNDGLGGQIIGGTVNITNLYSLSYVPINVPGAPAPTGYNVDVIYLREIL